LKAPRQSITIVEDEVVIAIASMMIYDDDIDGVFLHPGWLAVSSRPKHQVLFCWYGALPYSE
jgi:hypothetical protein